MVEEMVADLDEHSSKTIPQSWRLYVTLPDAVINRSSVKHAMRSADTVLNNPAAFAYLQMAYVYGEASRLSKPHKHASRFSARGR